MASSPISVLLPVRNGAATLARAVKSVLAQTLPPREVVVVDDGSTDGSGDCLDGLDARVRVLRSDGRGLVAALNLGLSACGGELVARMDADDVSLPERFAASAAALAADPSLGAVATQVEMVRQDRPVSPNMKAYAAWLNSLTSPEALFKDRFVESPLCHPAAVVRASALARVRGWEAGPFPEDYQLWLKLLSAGYRLTAVPGVHFQWADHDARLTRTDPRYQPAAMVRLKARFLAAELQGPFAIWGAGPTGKALCRALAEAGAHTTRFIELDPRKVGMRIHGAPVVTCDQLGAPREHLLVAVGAKGARQLIRRHLEDRGWREGAQFTCAA